MLELSYTIQATGWLTVQPDIQYIINPNAGLPNPFGNGQRTRLRDATIVGLRAGVTF